MKIWLNKNIRPFFKVPVSDLEMNKYLVVIVMTYLMTFGLTILEANIISFFSGSISPGFVLGLLFVNIGLWNLAIAYLEWVD